MREKRSENVNIRTTQTVKAMLQELASSAKLTVSAYIDRLIEREYLKSEKKKNQL